MSRSLLLFLMLLIGLLLAAELMASDQKSTPSPGWGGHGMAVFGGHEALYASHLPMFHAPHDAQVVLRFHLRDSAVDSALRAALVAHPELWTLDPEAFDLYRIAPDHPQPLRAFNARFVQGHFERGGRARFAAQAVVIDKVIIFRRLDDAPRTHSAGRYRMIGAGVEHFLVKEIDRRPDFDVIVALTSLRSRHQSKRPVITLATDSLEMPKSATLDAALRDQAGPAFTVDRVLYFETADLQ